jgi:hypothetical protein
MWRCLNDNLRLGTGQLSTIWSVCSCGQWSGAGAPAGGPGHRRVGGGGARVPGRGGARPGARHHRGAVRGGQPRRAPRLRPGCRRPRISAIPYSLLQTLTAVRNAHWCFAQVLLCAGMLTAALVDWALSPLPGAWRWMVAMPLAPALLMSGGQLHMHPRVGWGAASWSHLHGMRAQVG